MSRKKLLTYEGLEEYNIKWHERLQAMLMSDEELDEIWDETFPPCWSITIDTEAKTAGSKMGEISLIFNPNDEASQNASMTVDWGDGTVVTYTPETACGYTYPQHEYAIAGIYDILIESNDFDKLYMESHFTDEGQFYGPETYLTTLKRINNALPKIKGMHFYYHNDYVSTEDFDGSGGNNGNIDYGFFCGCESLESIPEDLFVNNTNITNFYCFLCGCTSLQSIPENLFANNIAATDFEGCFRGCRSLQSVPENLFINNTQVTNFKDCFMGCSSLADFTLHIGSSSVSSCSYFVTNKSGTTRTIYVPSGSTTQTTFNATASSLGLTVIGE